MSGILSGPEIQRQIELGEIQVDPYNSKHLNPASIDLTLGTNGAVYSYDFNRSEVRRCVLSEHYEVPRVVLDAASKPVTVDFQIPYDGLVLKPGTLYLLHTAERIHTKRFVTVIDGKSSIGRLGLCVHLTAGYGDPGFNGQYTLEVTSVYPTKIYPGMRFCQARFHPIVGEIVDYQDTGNYVGAASEGPVPSKAWRQFQEHT